MEANKIDLGRVETVIKPRKALWERIIEGICSVTSTIGVLFLICIALLTVVDVCLRVFLNSPIIGSTEVTEYLMITLVLGSGLAALNGKQIKMDLLMERFSIRNQAIVDTITGIITFLMFGLLTWYTFKEAYELQKLGMVSGILKIPAWPLYALLATGFGVVTLSLVVIIKNTWLKAVKR